MQILVSRLSTVIAILFSVSTTFGGGLEFNPDFPLYTKVQGKEDCNAHRLSELPAILDSLFATNKPVIIFVHGRGDEPKKTCQGKWGFGKAIHDLEPQYDARVVLFNWDSKADSDSNKDRLRPIRNIPAAATRLGEVLDSLATYRATKNQDRPLTLLAHSMGAIVVQTLVEKRGGLLDNQTKLFSNVVLSSSDADAPGHDKWVSNIASVENVYITVNKYDKILKKSKSGRKDGVFPLGLKPSSTLASNATYIYFNQLKLKRNKHHTLFNKDSQKGQVQVCEFFETVLRGRKLVFRPNNIEGVTYILRSEKNKKDPCFRWKE